MLKRKCRFFITSLVKLIYKTTLREKHTVLSCIIIIIDITITAMIVIIFNNSCGPFLLAVEVTRLFVVRCLVLGRTELAK